MSIWNEDELVAYCENLIAKKLYVIAEEILWEMNKRNRANPKVMVLLGRIFEETKQFTLALAQYNAALLLMPDDSELKSRRDSCIGRVTDTGAREGLGQMRAGFDALKKGDDLQNTQYYLAITQQQLQALREQVWPEIAAKPLERWTLSDADIDALTMGGKASFEYWTGSTADNLARGPDFPQIYTDRQIDRFLDMIEKREEFCYRILDSWLYDAIDKYPINGMDGAVIGSLSPWYESICLHFGARPTTVDYTKIVCKTSRLKYLHVDEFYDLENAFDFAISISSIEHDGLGGYQTSTSPDADIRAMQKLSRAVKPGGLVYFNVPVGADGVEYPCKRTYGRIRLPKILADWEIVQSWGFKEEYYDIKHPPEPFFVLRNKK